MMRILCMAASLCGLILMTGCPAGESSRCRELCQGVVACVDSSSSGEFVIDETECTTTCTALERDAQGRKKVDQYEVCVRQAQGCQQLLECNAKAAGQPATTAP